MTATIERSAGIPVAVGAMAFAVGCGYSGATDDLDGAVQAGAEALRDLFDHDVTIRFNSDRLSGGAWLKTNPNTASFYGNCEIGIGANLFDLAASRARWEAFDRKYKIDADDPDLGINRTIKRWAELGYDLAGPNQQVLFTVYIKRDYLRDPAAFVPTEDDRDVLYTYHRTLADAVDQVRRMGTDKPREIWAAQERAAAERRQARIVACEAALAPLKKKALLAILRGIDFKYRRDLPWNYEQARKDVLQAAIVAAAAANDYTYDPSHHAEAESGPHGLREVA